MSALGDPVADVELGQQKRRQRRRRRRQRQSIAGGNETNPTDGSRYFTDSEDDHRSWQSSWGSSAVGGSLDECRFPEIERTAGSRRRGEIGHEMTESVLVSGFDVDLESGALEKKVHVIKKKRVMRRDCRICHLRLMENGDGSDVGINLGCFCKGDLGVSHRQCAETWFRIKGNTICEICGAIAVNVMIEQPIINEASIMNMAAAAVSAANFAPTMVTVDPNSSSSSTASDAQNSWHGRRVMNVLLTCLVLAFVISWLFHSNMRSKN